MLKTKKLHRLMAGLLAVLMLCVSVPSVAFATEGNQETKSVGGRRRGAGSRTRLMVSSRTTRLPL